MTGEGELKGGVPAGSAVLTLAGGRFSLAKPKLEFTGLVLRVTLLRLPATAIEGEITFVAGRVADQVLGEGRTQFAFGEDGILQVSQTEVRGLGGTVTAAPFRFQPVKPEIAVTLHLARIALEEIIALLPPALNEARGRVDGEVMLKWSEAAGLSFGAGWMRLTAGVPATVRLAATPGLITAQLAAGNPAFGSLQRVELGQTPLNVRLLSAEFQPAGDALGRTATVHLEAEPVDAQLIAPILLEVNVAGPLDQLIKLGLDERVRMGGSQ